MNKYVWLALVFSLPLASRCVLAEQTNSMDMQHMSSSENLSEPSREYLAAMGNMHKDMAAGVKDPNPDIAFAKGMIPHHQGAIAMAETELKYGKDPAMRKMAENVIKAQKEEIVTMQQWIEAHPAGAR